MVKEDFSKMTKNQLQSGPNTKINDSRQPFNESKPTRGPPKGIGASLRQIQKWTFSQCAKANFNQPAKIQIFY